MNKIFKVIWDATAQQFVVTSELSKAKGKTKSLTVVKTTLAAAVATFSVSGVVHGAEAVVIGDGYTAASTGEAASPVLNGVSNRGLIAIGANATADNFDGSATAIIAIGADSYAAGSRYSTITLSDGSVAPVGAGTAIGFHSHAGYGATALGEFSYAKGGNATAIGGLANATGNYGSAMGYNTKALSEATIAIGREANASAIRDMAIGSLSVASGGDSTAIGSSSAATASQAVAIGYVANARSGNSTAIGYQSKAISAVNGTAVGYASVVGDTGATAIGTSARSLGHSGFAAGRLSRAHGDNSAAVGHRSYALGTNSSATGYWSLAATTGSIAMGTNATAGATQADTAALSTAQGLLAAQYLTANNATLIAQYLATIATEEAKLAAMAQDTIAIGSRSVSLGNQSIAVGVGNVVTGNNSGVFGDPSYITGNGSYAVGNNNTITTDNTFVLGSGINRHDTVLTTNLSGTVANSVYLGADSEVTAGAAATAGALKANTSAQTTDVATTAGATGTVTTATVGSLTYGGFQGDSAVGAVAVGAAGTERRIQSVAAGEISATSTDAINGSQLYATNAILGNVASSTVAALGDNVTLNPNGTFSVSYNLTGTDPSNSTATGTEYTSVGDALTALSEAVNQPLTFTGDEGSTTRELGSTLQIVAGNAKNTSTRNVKTNVTEEGKLEISISDTPSFTNITVDGNNTSPITIGADAAGNNYITNLTTTIPVPTTEVAEADKPTTNLTNAATLGDVLNAGWNLKENNTAKDVVTPYDTVNFVNGTGTTANITTTDGNFSNVTYHVNVDNSTTEITYTTADGKTVYLQKDGTYNTARDGSGNAVDEATITGSQVSAILPTFNNQTVAGDINFANSTTTNITYNSTTGDVTVDVKTGTSSVSDGTATDADGNTVAAGKAVADVTNGTVATISDVVNTINNVYWNTVAGNVTGTNGEFTSDATAKVKAGDTVTHNAGKNIRIEQTGTTFNISTTENVTFTNAVVNSTLSLGDVANSTTSPVVNMTAVNASTPISNGNISAIDVAGSTITNLTSNLPETVSTGDAATSTTEQAAPTVTDAQKTNAATLGDVLNAGWNLQENGTAKDFVKPYDTVNFVNGTGTTANITTDGNTSNVTYNVNVDNSTTEITYTTANGTKVYQITNSDGSVSYNTARDGSGTAVDEANITGSQVSAILPTFNGNSTTGDINFANSTTTNISYNSTTGDVTVDVKTGTSSVSDGTATDADGNTVAAGKAVANTTNGTVATIADVVDTINSVYHSVNSTTVV